MNATAAWFETMKAAEDFRLGGKQNPLRGGKPSDTSMADARQKQVIADNKARQAARKKSQEDAKIQAEKDRKRAVTDADKKRSEQVKAREKSMYQAKLTEKKRKDAEARKKKLDDEKATRAKDASTVARDRRAATDASRDATAQERLARNKQRTGAIDRFIDRQVTGKPDPRTRAEAEQRNLDRRQRKETRQRTRLGEGVGDAERRALRIAGGSPTQRRRLMSGAKLIPEERRIETRREQAGRNWRKIMGKDRFQGGEGGAKRMSEAEAAERGIGAGFKANQPLAKLPEEERRKKNVDLIDRLRAKRESGEGSVQTMRLLESLEEEEDKEKEKDTRQEAAEARAAGPTADELKEIDRQREMREKDLTDALTGLKTWLEGQNT